MNKKAKEILLRYKNEDLPEFVEIPLTDVNQHGNFGNTPLHVACVRGCLDEVKILLEAGADVNSKGELENTPLHDAVGQGHTKIVKLLLDWGVDSQIKNYEGNTAKDIAVLMKHLDIADIIEKAKEIKVR